MAIELGENRYGKSAVRLLRVQRHPDRHEICEWTVDVSCAGDLAAAYTLGDNRHVLPTDTMKNTVYALAREHPVRELEEFGLLLGRYFIGNHPQLHQVEVALVARPWARIEVAGQPHPHAFVESAADRRRAVVQVGRDRARVAAGIVDLVVLKSAGSGFEGFPRDRFTTLPESRDRILATRIRADWRYGDAAVAAADFAAAFASVRRTLLETFAAHQSRSLQHTLFAMGEAVLAALPEVEEIRLTLPNKHYLLAALAPFGLDNDGEVFVATDEPYGLIEGIVRRG
ncbi:MAG TPA: urate oxidase [Thermoanaerobaculia bacterium]|nr:urate oxidase [Thermoanaerobaculia bacterium]